jgi:hypothetical protein
MRKILMAAAMLPLLGGVALAAGPGGSGAGGSPHAGGTNDTAAGVTAYANAQQLWQAARNNPQYNTGTLGWLDTTNGQQQG